MLQDLNAPIRTTLKRFIFEDIEKRGGKIPTTTRPQCPKQKKKGTKNCNQEDKKMVIFLVKYGNSASNHE